MNVPQKKKPCPQRLSFLHEGGWLLSGPPAGQTLALHCEADRKRQAGASFREHRLRQHSALGRKASGAPAGDPEDQFQSYQQRLTCTSLTWLWRGWLTRRKGSEGRPRQWRWEGYRGGHWQWSLFRGPVPVRDRKPEQQNTSRHLPPATARVLPELCLHGYLQRYLQLWLSSAPMAICSGARNCGLLISRTKLHHWAPITCHLSVFC